MCPSLLHTVGMPPYWLQGCRSVYVSQPPTFCGGAPILAPGVQVSVCVPASYILYTDLHPWTPPCCHPPPLALQLSCILPREAQVHLRSATLCSKVVPQQAGPKPDQTLTGLVPRTLGPVTVICSLASCGFEAPPHVAQAGARGAQAVQLRGQRPRHSGVHGFAEVSKSR